LTTAVPLLPVTLSGHGEAARAVAFALDGNTLAIGSFDNDVHLWDWGTAKRVLTLKGHTAEVNLVAYFRRWDCGQEVTQSEIQSGALPAAC
jgi:WD40 repeat protein